MKYTPKKSPRSGFTLIELLTVIAVIGILAALIIPAVGGVNTRAQMLQSGSNLKQIATAYNTYANSGSRARNISATAASDIYSWAEVLATKAGLNDASVYYIPAADDVAELETVPQIVMNGNTLDSDFSGSPVSYSAVASLSISSPASTTPLVWTKNLDESSGIWPVDSPWGENAGHIAFLDAHVELFEGDDESTAAVSLVAHPKSGSNGTTNSISTAVGSGVGNTAIVTPSGS